MSHSHQRWAGRLFIICLTLLTALPSFSQAQDTAREECFPIERLPANLRPQAEALILKMLDSEALYTLVGGIKPMSSAFERYSYVAAKPSPADIARMETARELLSIVRCGDELYADVQVFATLYKGKRMAEACVFHRPTLARAIRAHPEFFTPFGLTVNSHPMEVAMVVEHDVTFDRNRGYGYLFGYPQYAVDFFVQAQESQKRTGRFVTRDFISVPTFSDAEHQFVWAAAKGHKPREEDRNIQRKAALILAAYKIRRARYIGEGKPGVIALLRDWFDDGQGHCSSANAERANLSLLQEDFSGKVP